MFCQSNVCLGLVGMPHESKRVSSEQEHKWAHFVGSLFHLSTNAFVSFRRECRASFVFRSGRITDVTMDTGRFSAANSFWCLSGPLHVHSDGYWHSGFKFQQFGFSSFVFRPGRYMATPPAPKRASKMRPVSSRNCFSRYKFFSTTC